MRLARSAVRIYATADPRGLGAGRIALALILLFDLARRTTRAATWYTLDGILPGGAPSWQVSIGFVAAALAYLALLVGAFTRIAHVASYLCLVALHSRVAFVANGGDVVLGELCLFTAFLPTGRRYSVDALRESLRSQDRLPDTTPVASAAMAALLLQLAFIYLFNAWSKTGTTWREGTALHYVLHQSRFVTAIGVWARDALAPSMLRGLTWGARALEWGLAALLLAPSERGGVRTAAVAGMWILHVGFALFLNLALFVPAMLAFTPFLLRAEHWNAIERGWRWRVGMPAAALLWLDARLPAPPTPSRAWRAVGGVVLAFVCMVAANQLLSQNELLGALRVPVSRVTEAVVPRLLLYEAWSMFAPDAPTVNQNVFVDAVTFDGRHVDPVSEIASPRHPFPGPHIPDRLDQDPFFCDYLPRVVTRPDHHPAFARWILRYAERTGRPADTIRSFEAFVVEQASPPPGAEDAGPVRVHSFLRGG